MKITLVILVTVLLGCVQGQIFTSYDQLYRTYFAFAPVPLNTTAAKAAGWSPISNTCNNNFGIAYTSVSGGPTETSPAFLYFTSAGQIAGFGARVFTSSWAGYIPSNLIPSFFVPVTGKSNAYDISLMFRSSEYMCSGQKSNYILGDRVSVNNKYEIPQTSDDATSKGWMPGACISEMGTHYSFDLSSGNGKMTWNSSNLLPVMPMYGVHDKNIKAILIASTTWQYTYPIGEYEGPIDNLIMCGNWCSGSGCTFSGTDIWSIFHWFFTDYEEVNCDGATCYN